MSLPGRLCLLGIVILLYGASVLLVDSTSYHNGEVSFSTDENEKVYTYEDIVELINEETDKFAIEVQKSRNWPHEKEELKKVVQNRRKRSANFHMPESIKDGIWPLNSVINSDRICVGPHRVIDMLVLPNNGPEYALCLIQTHTGSFELHFGPIFHQAQRAVVSLPNPRKIIAFPDPDLRVNLIVIILNYKTSGEEKESTWFKISGLNALDMQFRNELRRLDPKNSVFWPNLNKYVLYQPESNELHLIGFRHGNMDPIQRLPVSADLNLVYAFNIGSSPYLLLAYKSYNQNSLKDVRILSFQDSTFRQEATIEVSEEVLDAHHFMYGPDSGNSYFVFVTAKNLIFYKQMTGSPLKFLTFQRLPMANVRKVVPYGDRYRLFVMTVIFHTNDIGFITFNGFRFQLSKVQRRVFILPDDPVLFHHLSHHDNEHTVRMFVGRRIGGIESFHFTFVHDLSLAKFWRDNMNWCRKKRDEVMKIGARQKRVRNRFEESFLKMEPIKVLGSLTVPADNIIEQVQVHTQEYRQMLGEELAVDQAFFNELVTMQDTLSGIDMDVINAGHARLADALQIRSKEPQRMVGDLSFDEMTINQYKQGTESSPPNLATDQLNDQFVGELYENTVRLRGNNLQLSFIKPLHFEHLIMQRSLTVTAPVNKLYNMSQVVTRDGNHVITGRKQFHSPLLVDEDIAVGQVNGKMFNAETVLLTNVPQTINNPVTIHGKARANVAKVNHLNGHHLRSFFADVVRKGESVTIASPVEFASSLNVYDLSVNGSARLNGQLIDELMEDVLFLDRNNQNLFGEFFFHSNVHIDGSLYVHRVNEKKIPEDLVIPSQANLIRGLKRFESLVTVDQLDVTHTLNGLKIAEGMPDIMLKEHPQNITGMKMVNSVHIFNDSLIGGLINGLSLQELDQKARQKPEIRHFDRLNVANFADFKGGLIFGRFNSLSRGQFDQLMTQSVSIDQPWDHLTLGEVTFKNLFVNILECKTINGLNLEIDLLTLKTSQSISGEMAFNQVVLLAPSFIQSINGFPMRNLDNVFRTYGNQHFDLKVFGGDINMKSLKIKSINDIPIEEVVFMDALKQRTITGLKHFKSEHLHFDYLTVDDLDLLSINGIPVANLLEGTLRHSMPQTVPKHIQFRVLKVRENEDFRSLTVNSVNLRQLEADVVFAQGNMYQNITGTKMFTGAVHFEAIHFRDRFENITNFEMQHNWMLQGRHQKVEADFTFENVQVDNVFVHDSHLNGIDLNVMNQTVVRLDRKDVIHIAVVFVGAVKVEGNILLNGRLNNIDLRKDVIYSTFNGIQTIRGHIRLLNNVVVHNNLNVNGRINGIKVGKMCATMFQPRPSLPLVINGDVQIFAPLRVDVINNITFDELRLNAIRHDLPKQLVTGRFFVNTLVLNGQVQLDERINNVNLQDIFENYLSKTMDNQVITAEIVLQSDHETVFADDVRVRHHFKIENGIVDGVDLAMIDQTGLKVYGDQHFLGNLEFAANVVIDSNLNAQFINDFDTNQLMRKDRRVHSFLEDTVFTRSLTVKDNLNIVSGKKIADVNLEVLQKSAVQRDSRANYTVRGMKTFDSVTAEVIHTAKLSNVAFSKQNLLLRNADNQKITGTITFAGNILVKSVVAGDINGVAIEKLNREIVKKSAENVIETPVHFAKLNVATVEARGLIDKVNVSSLKIIGDTVERLEKIEQFSATNQKRVESFQKNMSLVAAKFRYFQLFHSVHSRDLVIERINTPLLISSMQISKQSTYLIIFLPKVADCYEVELMLKNAVDNTPWRKLVLYSPGKVLSVYQENDSIIVVSLYKHDSNVNAAECSSKNQPGHAIPRLIEGILFQVFKLLPQMHAVTVSSTATLPKLNRSPKVVHLGGTRLVACLEKSCTLVCLDCEQLDRSSMEGIEGIITKVANNHDTILVASAAPSNSRVTVLKAINDKLHNVFSVPVVNVKAMLVVSIDALHNSPICEYVLIAEGANAASHLFPVVHVWASNGTHFSKVQELSGYLVQEMHVFYPRKNHFEPYILMRTQEEIAIYRLLPFAGLQKHSSVHTSNDLLWATITSNNYLALYFAPDCHDQADSTVQPYLDILAPKFREVIKVGGTHFSVQEVN